MDEIEYLVSLRRGMRVAMKKGWKHGQFLRCNFLNISTVLGKDTLQLSCSDLLYGICPLLLPLRLANLLLLLYNGIMFAQFGPYD